MIVGVDMILETGETQDLAAILANKDWRQKQQQQLLATHRKKTLIAIKLNIPGAVKNNRYLQQIFNAGVDELLRQLQNYHIVVVMKQQFLQRASGPEAFVVVDSLSLVVKKLAIDVEENFALGRLFDIDIIAENDMQVSREQLNLPPRRCLVCNLPAKECARNQTHTRADLARAIERYYNEYFGEINEF